MDRRFPVRILAVAVDFPLRRDTAAVIASAGP
jgi:hypothetical protein